MKTKTYILLIISFLILCLVTIFIINKFYKPNQKKEVTRTMEQTGNNEIDNLINSLKISMENYMKDANPSYSQADINECVFLLTDYTKNILKSNSKKEGIQIVKSTITKMNDLNEKCDHELIETDEREKIAEIIILGGNKMGYNSVDEDITEEWREW